MLRGVHTLLESLFDTTMMVSDERSLLETAASCRHDVCFVDLMFPVTAEINVIRLMRKHCPALPVVVLSLHDEPSVAQDSLAQGATAFVLKRTALADLAAAVDAIRRGETYVSPAVRFPPRGPNGSAEEAPAGNSCHEPRPQGMTS
jgi:DNA-binding NarL/FixJ family response regulator